MIVIVAGMHRSGTSAMAGLLHGNNIVMGKGDDFYPPPMKENPMGFFENVRFRRLNDNILKKHGYSVKSFRTNPPNMPLASEKQMAAMAALIEEYHAEFKNFGWKDPRTSLTLNSWLEILDSYGLKDETRIIQMVRPAEDVAASMIKRGNKEDRPGQFAELNQVYEDRLAENLVEAGFEDQRIGVSFHSLLHGPREEADRIGRFINVALSNLENIDPTLERTEPNESEGDQVSDGV